jgi:Protein of unknown function (DUF1549)/Protein of unknown function (DUF1553)/Bacterial Ig-like domain (group 2)
MTRMRFFLGALALLCPIALTSAQEKLPANAKIVQLTAKPTSLDLKNPFDYRQLTVDAALDTGDVVDVTRMVNSQIPATLVKVSQSGLVRPVADGKGEIKINFGGQNLSVPVIVSGQKSTYQVSFIRDVMPLMSRIGCNAGTCHGSAEGKNGFKLSLRGYDPLLDHRALTDDLEGRRFNRAAADRSLMLMKPAGAVPHVGGVVWQPGDPSYELVKLWITEGVKLELSAPRVTKLDVLPKDRIIPEIGQKQQMVVMATYSDGTVRDVSAESFIESSNTEVATVDKTGLVTTIRRGEATMLARYEGAYDAGTLIVMGDRSGFQWKQPESFNFIDDLVYDKLKRVKILPSELCTDEEFIRRVTLDLIGLPPEPEEVLAFLANPAPSKAKRDALVDKLVGSEPYIEHWTNKWADLLQVNRKFLGDVGAKALRDYIRKSVAENKPYDKFAYEILTASGSNAANGPAAYYKILRSADAAMENSTHLFMAVRFNCNKCHDHPFERWTQDQYYNLASYFAQVSRNRDPKYPGTIGGSAVEGAVPMVEIIADTNSGEVKHDRTGEFVKPKFPFEIKDMPDPKLPRRVQLAKWTASKENPYFAKSYVNRVWSYLLGVGIIEPIDDIRAGNPATNPALLDRLTKEFMEGRLLIWGIRTRFDVQQLIKTICKSRTYQLSIKTNQWNAGDEINYSHALARRMPAEVLYDAIMRATGSSSKIPGLPPGARAAQVIDGSVDLPSGFLELFGKPLRESACECERSSGLQLGPVLSLVNGPIVADAIKDPNNRIAKLAASVKDDAKFVEAIYLATLSRKPTAKELQLGLRALKDAEADYNTVQAEYNQRLQALKNYEMQLDAKQAAWEKGLTNATKWEVLNPDPKRTFAKNRKGTTITIEKGKPVVVPIRIQVFGSVLQASVTIDKSVSLYVTGANPPQDLYTIEATTGLKRITAIRLDAMNDDRLPAKGPGRAPNGNFVLSEFKVTATPAGGTQSKPVALQNAKATFAQDTFPIGNAIDGNPDSGWAVAPQFGKTHTALFELKEPIANEVGTKLTIVMEQNFAGGLHNLGKFRISVTGDAVPRLGEALPAELANLLATPADKRTPEQKARLAQLFRDQDGEYKRLAGIVASNPLPPDKRVLGGQDLMWALINNPAFLFNH